MQFECHQAVKYVNCRVFIPVFIATTTSIVKIDPRNARVIVENKVAPLLWLTV